MNKLKCCICGFEREKSILSHVRQKHNISAKEYRDKFHSPLRVFSGDLEFVKNLGKNNSSLLLGKPGHAKLKEDKWSREYDFCVECGRTDSKHISNGLCKKCYSNKKQRSATRNINSRILIEGKENQDYVICRICLLPFQSLTSNGHLKTHNIDEKEYKKKFPFSKTYCSNVNKARSLSVSKGRKKLMAVRGYLNPPSQRLSKSKEMAKRHANKDFAKISKIEGVVSDYFISNGYFVFWNNYVGDILDNVIIRQYLFQNCYCVDFACPYKKIIVEVLGDWWHGWEVVEGNQNKKDQHPIVRRNMRLDINRFNYIKHKGWVLLKIWEHDIKNENFKNILSQYFVNRTL